MEENVYAPFADELRRLSQTGGLRQLPGGAQDGKWLTTGGRKMLNLSSNDYLGLAADVALREAFLHSMPAGAMRFSASSSRLLTGNFAVYDQLERLLASLYGAEAAVVFSSGYHMNTGILPALCDRRTLVPTSWCTPASSTGSGFPRPSACASGIRTTTIWPPCWNGTTLTPTAPSS